jgi:serine/threonine protein kinase
MLLLLLLLLLLPLPRLLCLCVQVTGTPGFRAPEVMDVGWGKAADTYAFGIIAWQLLTGAQGQKQ